MVRISISMMVMSIALIILGTSDTWFTLTLKGTKDQVIQSGDLALVLDDTASDGITVENGVPMLEEVALTKKGYTFTLENKGNINSEYTIYLDDLDIPAGKEKLADNHIRYNLQSDQGFNQTKLFSNLKPSPTWDLSTEKNNSIVGYLTGNETDGYTVYIQANGPIYANSSSNTLFNRMTRLATIEGMENFDTSKVTNMSGMFYECNSLTQLDLSGFNTLKVINMDWMFGRCKKLTVIKLNQFDFTNVTSYESMFDFTPTSVLVYVKDITAQTWLVKFVRLSNILIATT